MFLPTLQFLAVIILLTIVAIFLGMIGFYFVLELSPVDSFYNSAMYLSGLDIPTAPVTDAQKIFCGIYAILAAFFFFGILTFLLAQFLGLVGA